MQINKIRSVRVNSSAPSAKTVSKVTGNYSIKSGNLNLNNAPSALYAKTQVAFRGSVAEDLYDYTDKNIKEENGPGYTIKNDPKAEFAKLRAQYVLIPEAARILEDADCIGEYVFSIFGKAGKTPQKTKILNAVYEAQNLFPPKDKSQAASEIVKIDGSEFAAKLTSSEEGLILSVTSLNDGTQADFISSGKQNQNSGIFYLKTVTTPEYNVPNYKIHFDDYQNIDKVAFNYAHERDDLYNAQRFYTINRTFSPDNYERTKPLNTSLNIDMEIRANLEFLR